MNKDLASFLSNFFSFTALSGYVSGVVTALIVVWIVDKQHNSDRIHRMRLMATLWVLMVFFVGYVGVEIQRNAICIVEVLDTLAVRADLSDQADKLSDKRDEAATKWLTTKDYPPSNIAALRWEDPVRQQWIHDQDAFYIFQITEIQQERKKAIKDKASHKLPESRCGKN